jgi:hypothetical protein
MMKLYTFFWKDFRGDTGSGVVVADTDDQAREFIEAQGFESTDYDLALAEPITVGTLVLTTD